MVLSETIACVIDDDIAKHDKAARKVYEDLITGYCKTRRSPTEDALQSVREMNTQIRKYMSSNDIVDGYVDLKSKAEGVTAGYKFLNT